MTNDLQALPGDDRAEKAVISAAFIDENFVLVEAQLEPEHFRNKDHAAIWAAMLSLWNGNMGVTPMTVEGELKKAGHPLPLSFLTKFTVDYEPPYTSIAIAARLRDLARRRALVEAATRLTRDAYNESIPVDEISSQMTAAADGTVEEHDMTDGGMLMDNIIAGAVNPKTKGAERIFTGIGGIDSKTLGLEAGRFWVGAAVPNTGKSIFTMAIARGVLGQPSPAGVLYIHPEQGDIELSNVMLSSGTKDMRPVRIKLAQLDEAIRAEYTRMLVNQNPHSVRQIFGEDFRLSKFTEGLSEDEAEQLRVSRAGVRWPIKYLDPKNMSIFALARKMRAFRSWLTKHHGPDAFMVVVVDGLHLLAGAGESSRVAELTTITRQLKISSGDDIKPGCVIANHQLNYQFYQGDMSVPANRHYTLRGLRDSGSIGQDADMVYFIDRQTVFNQDKSNNGAALPTWDPFSVFFKKNRQTSQLFTSKYELNTATLAVRDKEESWG